MDSEAPTSFFSGKVSEGKAESDNERPRLLIDEVEFVDEEAMFNMPLLLDCMAQGMLLTPPALCNGFTWTNDQYHPILDFNLWTQQD